jgi:hypothetical protein
MPANTLNVEAVVKASRLVASKEVVSTLETLFV